MYRLDAAIGQQRERAALHDADGARVNTEKRLAVSELEQFTAACSAFAKE